MKTNLQTRNCLKAALNLSDADTDQFFTLYDKYGDADIDQTEAAKLSATDLLANLQAEFDSTIKSIRAEAPKPEPKKAKPAEKPKPKKPAPPAFALTVLGKEPPNVYKSATGGIQSFLSKYYSNPAEQTGESEWKASTPLAWDWVLYNILDKHTDTKRVMEDVVSWRGLDSINQIADKKNIRRKETLFHNRVASRVRLFMEGTGRGTMGPVFKAFKETGVKLDEIGLYMQARHAKHRNALMAQRNPDNPDMQDGGSGMTNQEAQDYLDSLSEADKERLEKVRLPLVDVMQETRNVIRGIDDEYGSGHTFENPKYDASRGVETPETIKAWEEIFGEFYIPLIRADFDQDGTSTNDYVAKGHGTGKGFSITGPTVRAAMGSDKEVVNVVANIVAQRDAAYTRTEKRMVGEAVYKLAASNPNKGFWMAVDPNKKKKNKARVIKELREMGLNDEDAKNVYASPLERHYDEQSGLVRVRVNTRLREMKNVLVTKINGQERLVIFNQNDPRAFRMSVALKNLEPNQLNVMQQGAAYITRWIAQVNTQYNPMFGPVNFARDIQAAMLNMSTTELKGQEKKVATDTAKLMWGMYRDLRAKRAGKEIEQTDAIRDFDEFDLRGGKTGFRDMFASSELRAKSLARAIKRESSSRPQIVGAITGWLTDYNDVLENAVRVAVYKNARDMFIAKIPPNDPKYKQKVEAAKNRAAEMGKDMTVNFNRKGQIALQAGAMYAFFNASMQGTAKVVETLAGPRGKKIVIGGVLWGAIQPILLAWAGFDEEEIPEFIRERNLIIPTGFLTGGLLGGEKGYNMIPMPLGFHVIPNLGRLPMEHILSMGRPGAKSASDRFINMTGMLAEAFNPLGSAGWSYQTISPTPLDPIAGLAENKTWNGRPIYREDINHMRPTTGVSRTRDTSTVWSRKIAEITNQLTGGDKYSPGWWSPTPEHFDYLFGFAGGGIVREASKLQQTVSSQFTGEELPPYKIPGAGRFYGNAASSSTGASLFYDRVRKINIVDEKIKNMQKDRVSPREFIRSTPLARLRGSATAHYNKVAKLRRIRRKMLDQGVPKHRVQAIEAAISQQVKNFNTLYERTVK